MAKKDTEVKDKKRGKKREQCLEEVIMEEKVVCKEEGTISTKRKKKKKELVSVENEQNDITEVEEKMENGEKKKKKKKKKSSDISALDGEHIEATESIEANVKTEEQHADAERKKTKKKKKKLQQQEDIKSEEAEAVVLVCESGKRMKNGESVPAGHDDDISGEEASVATLKKIKKKKKKRQSEDNRDIDENGPGNMHEQSADTTESVSAEGETEKKKKKRRKTAHAEGTCVEFELATQDKQEKKKKKRKEVNLEGDPSTTRNIKQTEHKKGKRKKADGSRVEDVTHKGVGADLVILEERNAEGKAKKGKKKDISVNTETPELNPNHTEGEKKRQKKKLKKEKAAAQQAVLAEEDEGEATGTKAVNGKKRKKKQTDSNEAGAVAETPTPKKKKKLPDESAPAKAVKQEEMQSAVSGEEHQEVTDVVFLSEKPGNQDEFLIDQERRLALQKDIDKESQPKSTFGQWSTATFDNADQQQKFLRLMGGFKKGSPSPSSSAGRPNMAMGKEEQQNLEHKLLGQFQQAQNRRMDFSNKGAGLGFVAPSNKKFAIDVNASRSIKFDD